MEEVQFRIDSNFFENVLNIGFSPITNSECTLHFNNELDIEVPLFVAISCFPTVSQSVMSDATARDFHIEFEFPPNIKDRSSFYDKVSSLLKGHIASLTRSDVFSLALLGKQTGNSFFVSPLECELKSEESSLSSSNALSLACRKHDFGISLSSCLRETELLSSDFEHQKSSILGVANDVSYIDLIDSIVSNNRLVLDHEDSLLRFVLDLCNISSDYESLFTYVMLEYCSTELIREFVSYVDKHLDSTHHVRSIFTCMSRRVVEPRLPKSPNYTSPRHKDPFTQVPESDPLNGILRRLNSRGLVTMETSSTNGGNVYDLIKANENADFHTQSQPNSWIKASLKENKSFIISHYMIRGRKYEGNSHLKSWKFEGQKKSNGEWIVLDTHNEEPFGKLVTRVFPVSCNELLTSVRLTQTTNNTAGADHLCINALDIFGSYEN